MSVSFKDIAKYYRKSRLGMFGLGLLIFFLVLAALAPIIAPNDPDQLNIVGAPFAAPEWLGFLDPNYFPDTVLNPDPELTSKDSWSLIARKGYAELVRVNVGNDGSSFLIKIPKSKTRTLAYLETPASWGYDAIPRDVWISYSVRADIEGTLGDLDVYVTYVPKDFDRVAYLAKAVELLISPKDVTEYGIVLTRIHLYGEGWISSLTRLTIAEIRAFFQKRSEGFLRLVIEADTREGGGVGIYVDKLELKALSAYHGILGTSDTGADAWSQLIWGTHMALLVGILATLIAITIGVTLGLIAGYFGGVVDEFVMRVVDFLFAIPTLPILLLLAAFLGPRIWNIVIILALLNWLMTARIIRSQVLSEKAKPYVEAARAAGAGDFYIIFKHILPNVLPLVFVQLTLFVSLAIQIEAALSFLGLGPVEVITWGKMLEYAFRAGAIAIGAWWYVIPPGLFIALMSMAFIFIGTTLDQILNPRLRRR